jgi:aspartate-semialdehyde dehydrogenase
VTLIFDEEDRQRLHQAIEALACAEGVVFQQDPAFVPTPAQLSGVHGVSVGRVRSPFPDTLQFWVVGDQVLKGAALNTVQIAELWSRAN